MINYDFSSLLSTFGDCILDFSQPIILILYFEILAGVKHSIIFIVPSFALLIPWFLKDDIDQSVGIEFPYLMIFYSLMIE